MNSYKVSIIGAGTVGTAVGYLLKESGYEIAAIAARHRETLEAAHLYTGGFITTDVVEAASMGNLIFITTPDDQIEKVCEAISVGGGFKPGDTVFHMSGALSNTILMSAKGAGAGTGSIHPMQSFASVDMAIKHLPGSVFGITVDDKGLPLARQIVEALGGEGVLVRDEDKPLYHAAACAVCNYFVTLIRYGETLYESIGIPRKMAIKAFLPLLRGTLGNIENYGTAKALTGPIARGDVGTIKKHLVALEKAVPEGTDLYKLLGRYTVKLASEKGTITSEKARALNHILGGKDE